MLRGLNYSTKKIAWLRVLGLAVLVSACASGQNLNDGSGDDEPQGRGILSGSSGEFVIYGD